MGFAQGAWRITVAIKDALVLLFMLIFFGIIYAMLSATPNAGAVREGALVLNLKGSIVESAPISSAQDVLNGNGSAHTFLLRDLVRALDAAAKDDRVKAVVLDLSGFTGGGQVVLERVGAALDAVKAARKPVLVYANGYDDAGYLVAAHASEIWLDSMGIAAFPGPGGSHLYYKGLIDKLGANVHVYRVGKYKSFVEPYTRADQSPEAKEAGNALIKAVWADWQANVGQARANPKLTTFIADPQAATAASGGDLAKAALAAHVVDTLGDPYAFGDHVAKLVGADDDNRPGGFRTIKLNDWLAANPASTSGSVIGVVTVAGEIIDGKSTGNQAGGDTIAAQIEKAIKEGEVKALVLRIDSPGGSVAASEKIRLALMQAKKAGIPVVASMSSVAASGGYWISTPADKVFAEPATITGSIGVFGIIPTFERTLAKLGVTHDGVTTTPLSGQPDVMSGTTPQLDSLIQTSIDATYQRFIGLVASARNLAPDRVNEIAQGRVWDGGSAQQLKLVDRFGGLEEAIVEAAHEAKLAPDDVHAVYLEEGAGWFQSLFAAFAQPDDAAALDPVTQMARSQTAQIGTMLDDAQHILNGPVVQVRCLECAVAPKAPAHSSLFEALLKKVI